MTSSKRDSIIFSSGREIVLPGGVVSITRDFELADYYSRNIFYLDSSASVGKVVNIHNLSKDEMIELSDLMIQLWIELKNNIRSNDINSPAIFNSKSIKKNDK